MNNYEQLYKAYQESKIQREKDNLNGVLKSFETEMIKILNQRYQEGISDSTKMQHYKNVVHNLKSKGIRVLRNPNGEHKLIITKEFVR